MTLLEDSQQRKVSKTLLEKWFYEFAVVSTASKLVDYQLTVTAENPPERELTERLTKEPIEEPTLKETPIQ